ncbi:hypothetical protein [Streptomyces sp. ISL-11]|uniref:hypothetical protein n=1 Tax=Streptomyces sp. ISL-11 TaxID=2819174 RepID=UPI001BE7F04A|nr:hypothetical protein [Streptomyces sp. ISL-11]MBT2385348.1 hypothetical protein [Streptomyces sp. ISL-11]
MAPSDTGLVADALPAEPYTWSARDARRGAVAGLVLLAPMAIVSFILYLTTERAAACLMNGEQCSAWPGAWIYGGFFAAAVLGVLAVNWPERWARSGGARALTVLFQWGAQLIMAAAILS